MTEIRPEYLAYTVWDSLPTTEGRGTHPLTHHMTHHMTHHNVGE
jgi:hypothetical protein